MENPQQNRLFPEKGPERIRDTILSILLSACGSLFITNQEIFQSDVLYISAVIQDLYNGTSILGWTFTPAPYFFPDLTLYAILYSILDHGLALRVYGIIQATLAAFLLLRLFSPPGKRYGIFRLLFSLQFLALVYFQDFYAFLYLPGMHCSALIASLILFHRIRHEELLPWKGIYIGLLSLVILSDRLMLVQGIVPTLISLLYANRLRKKNPDYARRVPRARVNYWFKVAGSALLIGICLNLIILWSLSVGKVASISPLKSFVSLARDFENGFGTPNLFYAQCLILLLFSVFLSHRVLLATETEIRRSEKPSLIFYGRISSSNLLFFIWLPPLASIISGAYIDAYSIRYFAGSFIVANAGLLSILCSVGNRPTAHLSRFTGPLSMAFRRTGAIVFSFLILIFVVQDRFFSSTPTLKAVPTNESWPDHYPGFVECIDAMAAAETVMADYWHAKPIYLFSRKGVLSYHADYITGKPSSVIANRNWWKNRWPPDAVYMANLNPDTIRKALGEPSRIVDCHSGLSGPNQMNQETLNPGKKMAPVWIYGKDSMQ
ncbi:MAG: hypothetical protein CMF59_14490 [Leptospiraceae bacterium]|nr:hypothetical protein [Leptospiraceae bacterium]